MQDLCGYDERKVRYTLNKMREEGIIDLKGTGRYSCYVLFKPTINRQSTDKNQKYKNE